MTEGAVSSYDNPYLSLIDNVVSAQQVLTIVVIGIFFFALCRPYMKRKLLSWRTLSWGRTASTGRITLLSEQNKRVDAASSETNMISSLCQFNCLMHPTLTMH